MNDDELKNFATKQCENYVSKGYRHFDSKISKLERERLLSKSECHSFLNPEFVKKYRSFPLIRFNQEFDKYGRNGEKKKHIYAKVRPISITSHQEALLLKLYAIMLNVRYEERLKEKHIESIPIAYRSRHDNITGAKDVFDFIWKEENAWIIKGDFHAFFDCLNHKMLLRQVKSVLTGTENGRISEDWVAVIKLVTKYRTVDQIKIDRAFKNVPANKPYVKSIDEFGKCVKSGKIQVSKRNDVGIPQGTAISAVLANVYMMRFDQQVHELVSNYGGIYRRYSDDFVVAIPKSKCSLDEVKKLKNQIVQKSFHDLRVTINPKKTKLFEFSKNKGHVYNVDKNRIQNFDYLGFEFTGKNVILRAKTLYKFHYRGMKSVALLTRNMRERKIVDLGCEQEYINRRQTKRQIRQATERIDNAKSDIKKGYSIRDRKKVTRMYLVVKPVKKKNMMAYATRAEKVMSRRIQGCDSLYGVQIEQRIRKEISKFQEDFGDRRRKLSQ